MLRQWVVCAAAGIAAGVGTGFAGMSASSAIVPMLVTFLGIPWYESVGIGLAADVLASAFSAYVYKRHGNLDLKNALVMVASVLVMTVVGSYFSQYLPSRQMGYLSVLAVTLMGLRFIIWPATKQSQFVISGSKRSRTVLALICGIFIGFYCGFMGLGGGMMMLFILTTVLRYDLRTAVGTSVFVMTFIALTGAGAHFYFADVSAYLTEIVLCVVFTLIAAVAAAAVSNHMKDTTTNRVTGIVLVVLAALMLWETFL